MTKKAAVTAVTIVAILVALSLFTGLAFAAAHTVTGEVILANPSVQTLMINTQALGMTFDVMEEAAKALGKLKPGDKVTVSYSYTYTEPEGKLTAQSIAKLPVGG